MFEISLKVKYFLIKFCANDTVEIYGKIKHKFTINNKHTYNIQ